MTTTEGCTFHEDQYQTCRIIYQPLLTPECPTFYMVQFCIVFSVPSFSLLRWFGLHSLMLLYIFSVIASFYIFTIYTILLWLLF